MGEIVGKLWSIYNACEWRSTAAGRANCLTIMDRKVKLNNLSSVSRLEVYEVNNANGTV